MHTAKYIWVICAVITAVLFLSVCTSAAGTPVSYSYTIAEFDSSEEGFAAGSNTDGVRTVTVPDTVNGKTYTRTCLEAVCNYRNINSMKSVTAKFENPHFLAEYRSLVYDIFVPAYASDPNAVYYTRVKLISADGTSFERVIAVEGGRWQNITADISGFVGRSAIVSLEISLVVDTSVVKKTSDGFYIDSVGAAGAVDRDMTSRFLFDEFRVTGGEGTVSDDKTLITLSSEEHAPLYISADLVMPDISYPANSLRIELANGTDSRSVMIHYTTMDSQAVSEAKSVTVEIEPQSGARYYYAYVGDASMLQSMEMIFGDGAGTADLVSVSPVHRYEPEKWAVCGEITSCKLYTSGSVSFSGNINRDAALAYSDSKIAVYSWNRTELPTEQELSLLTPLAIGDMTARFELIHHMDRGGDGVRYGSFIAVVLHADGTYTLISKPFYVDNPALGSSGALTLVPDEKGFSADDLSLVTDAGTGITVISVDAERFFAGKSEGRPFTVDGSSYYINGAYADSLTRKINMLSSAGVMALIRIEGYSEAFASGLEAAYSADMYVSPVISADAVDGTDYLDALAAYIAENLCSGRNVCGIILGLAENTSVRSHISLTESAERMAMDLRSVYNRLLSVNSGAKVYLSVDDSFDCKPLTDFSRYMLVDYIPAVISAAKRLGGFNYDIAVEVSGKDINNGQYISIDNCTALTELLDSLGAENTKLIFCDETHRDFGKRLSTLMHNYVIGYYNSYFNGRIDAYIAIAGARGPALSETVRYIDTTDVQIISNAAIITTKADSIEEIIAGYDKEKLKNRRLSSGEMSAEPPIEADGAFPYFRFDSMTDVSGVWSVCYGDDLKVVNDGGAAMSVSLRSDVYGDGGSPAWFGVLHNFSQPENLKLTPVIKVTLKVDGVVPEDASQIAVKAVFRSENERFEAFSTVNAGEYTTLYIDTKPFGGRRNATSFGLYVGDGEIDGAVLTVRAVEGLSSEYDDKQLAERIAEEREKRRLPDAEPNYRPYFLAGGVVMTVIATVLVLVLLTRRRESPDDE